MKTLYDKFSGLIPECDNLVCPERGRETKREVCYSSDYKNCPMYHSVSKYRISGNIGESLR
jgi:hypothetical protein